MRWSLNKLMRAVNLWRAGYSIKDICDLMECTEGQLREMLPDMKKMGLDRL